MADRALVLSQETSLLHLRVLCIICSPLNSARESLVLVRIEQPVSRVPAEFRDELPSQILRVLHSAISARSRRAAENE